MKKAVLFLEGFSRRIPSSSPVLGRIYSRFLEAYRKYHNSKVMPLIRRLSSKYNLVVISLDQNSGLLLKGIPHKSYHDYINLPEIDEKSMRFVRALMQENEQLARLFTYGGYSLWELEEVDIWGGFVASYIRHVEVIRAVMKTEHPDAVIVLDGNTGIGKAAKSMGIPCVNYTSLVSSSFAHAQGLLLKSYLRYLHKKTSIAPGFKSPAKPQRNRVVMLTDTPRVLRDTLLWSRQLKSSIKLLAIGPNKEPAFSKQVSYRRLSSYLSSKDAVLVRKKVQQFHLLSKRLRKDQKLQKSIMYEGIKVYKPLSEMFDYLFYIGIPRTIAYIKLFGNLIDAEKPRLCVLYGDRMNFGRTACKVFSRRKVNTLVIQLGMINENPMYGPITATKMAVFGNGMKDVLVRKGNSPSKLVITGQPRFDEIFTGKYSKQGVYRQYGIESSKKIVLFTSQNIHDEHDRKLFTAIMNAMKDIPNARLIIKLHPDEEQEFAHKMKNICKSDAVITKGSLYELMNASDAVITFFSTTAWEALLFRKPLIIANFTGDGDLIDTVKQGAALGVYREEDMKKAIRDALYNKSVVSKLLKSSEKYAYSHTYRSDGMASYRVARLVEKLAQ